MGKATIIANHGKGLYEVRLDFSSKGLDDTLAKLMAEQAAAQDKISKSTRTVANLTSAKADAADAVSALIEVWKIYVADATQWTPPDIDAVGQGTTAEDEQPGMLLTAINALRPGGASLSRVTALDSAIRGTLEALVSSGRCEDVNSTAADRAAQAGYGYDQAIGAWYAFGFGLRDATRVVAQWQRNASRQGALIDTGYTECGCCYLYRPSAPYIYYWGVILSAPGAAHDITWPSDPALSASDDSAKALKKIELPKTEDWCPKQLAEASGNLARIAMQLKSARSELDRMRVEQLAREKRIQTLQGLKAKKIEHHAWHTRFVDDLTIGAQVHTGEIPGYRDHDPEQRTTQLETGPYAYGELDVSIVPSTDTGQDRWTETLNDAAVFVDAALEPGQLRWRPTWRYGTIVLTPGDAQPTLGPTTWALLAADGDGLTRRFSPDYAWKPCDHLVVAPNGWVSGGDVTPGADDQVSVAAMVACMAAAPGADAQTGRINVAGAQLTVQRSTAKGHLVTSIAIAPTYEIQAWYGKPGIQFSAVAGEDGGPAILPYGWVEIARVNTYRPEVHAVRESEIETLNATGVIGTKVTPSNDGVNLVDVHALTWNGVSVPGRIRLPIARATGDDGISPAPVYRINSIVVNGAGALQLIAGEQHLRFSEARGAKGGPPWIPVDAIEIAQLRFKNTTPGPVAAAEILTRYRERADLPAALPNPYNRLLKFDQLGDLRHVGATDRRVYARVEKAQVFAIALEQGQSRHLSGEGAMALDSTDDLYLWDVPTSYPCPLTFEIGDAVLVEYQGHQRNAPLLIGYRREPKTCFVGAGILSWNALTPALPLWVHTGDKAKAYTWPKSWDGEKYQSQSWISDAPWQEYPNLVDDFWVATEMMPSRWTGLARLAIQGCHSIKRHPEGLFLNYPNPAIHGLWRGAQGRYWTVEIGSAGLKVQALALPENAAEARSAQAMLLDGKAYPQFRRNMAEALVLANLVKTGTPATLLDAAAMAALSAHGAPLSHGWKFARGVLKAAIVLRTETEMPEFPGSGALQNNFTAIEIAAAEQQVQGVWSIATPTVSVGATVRVRPRAGWTNLWRSQYGSAGLRYFAVTAESVSAFDYFAGNVAPVDVRYSEDDVCEALWYIQHSTSLTNFNTLPGLSQCGTFPFDAGGQTGWTGTQTGGFAIRPLATPPTATEFTEPYSYTRTEVNRRTVEPGGTQQVTYSTTSDNPFREAQAYFCGSGIQDAMWAWYAPAGYAKWAGVTYTFSVGTQTEEVGLREATETPSAWAAIIAYDDAEAWYVLKSPGATNTGDRKLLTATASQAGNGAPIFAGSVHLHGWNVYGETGDMDVSGGFSQNLIVGSVTNSSVLGYVGSILDGAAAWPVVEPGTVIPRPAHVEFSHPGGSISLNAAGAWGEFFPESILDAQSPRTLLANAVTSYGGDGVHYDGQGNVVMRGGYQVSGEPPERMFVGGA